MTWTVVIAVLVLGAGLVFARVMTEAGFPTMVALVIFGLVVGPMLPGSAHFVLSPGLLGLFLPALIFEAAWDADLASLRRTALAVFVLAVPGTLITTAIVAFAAVAAHALPWPAALVLGAIVAPTDPVAVLALFRALRLPLDLVTIVDGESVANDGVAVVLAQGFVAYAASGVLAGGPLGEAARMLAQSGGGIAIGILLAVPGALFMRLSLGAVGRVAITVVVAYGAYALASLAGASGIFAAAASGIALRAFARIELGSPAAQTIDRAWDVIALCANSVVFLLVGLTLRLDQVVRLPALVGVSIAAVVASRLLLAYVLVPIGRLTDDAKRWRHAIALAGLRGGLSLALALGLPPTVPSRDAVVAAVFAVVFLTLVVQGPVVAPLLRRLGLGGPPGATVEGNVGIAGR